MDIRNWPIDRIMQLPDCCFGRRFMLAVSVSVVGDATGWDISELAFPERAVIWEMHFFCGLAANNVSNIRIALGDQLPASRAQMNALEPLFPGVGVQGAEPRIINVYNVFSPYLAMLRIPVNAMGRRLVMELTAGTGEACYGQLLIVVSSIPTEVPDWLISGPGRSRL